MPILNGELKTKLRIIFLAIVLVVFFKQEAFANKIIVTTGQEQGPVNQKIFGTNLLAHKLPDGSQGNRNSDFGAGIWDPRRDAPVEEVIRLAQGIRVSTIRFPGGRGSHQYDWKKTIGKERKGFAFGLDEFLETAKEIGAEPVITVSYFIGDETDAADLVEYLNAPNDGHNLNGGIDWAAERAKNKLRDDPVMGWSVLAGAKAEERGHAGSLSGEEYDETDCAIHFSTKRSG